MHIADSEWVPSTPEETWKALHDPGVLQCCITGCESVEQRADNEYAVVMTARVGGARRRFSGEILLSEEAAPHQCQIVFEGAEEHAGLAIGHANVSLEPSEHGGTRIRYELHAAAGGALVHIGKGPLEQVCRKMVDDFFTHLVDYMASRAPAYASSTGTLDDNDMRSNRGPGSAISWLLVAGTVAIVVMYYAYMH